MSDRPCHLRCLAGQLGIGELTQLSTTPVAVVGLSGVSSIHAGYWHTCAALADGTARCWGINYSGKQTLQPGAPVVHQ